MKPDLQRVGCMPLLDYAAFRPITSVRSAADDIQPPLRLPAQPCSDATPSATGLFRGIHTPHHAGRLDINNATIPLLNQESKAANHPRPHATHMRGSLHGRRVHWLVRARRRFDGTPSAPRPPRASGDATRELNHVSLATSNPFLA